MLSDSVISDQARQYCTRWELSQARPLASTFTSNLYFVKQGEHDRVLKLFNEKGLQFEAPGSYVLQCFGGIGAVSVISFDAGAVLLEFIDGQKLKSLVLQNQDERATGIVCEVIKKLRAYTGPVPIQLISMERNFRALFQKAQSEGPQSLFARAALVAKKLIQAPREHRVLHGDLHHENILESSSRGWLAIDPQCLAGESTYDFANTFYNPDGMQALVALPKTIHQRCKIFSEQCSVESRRILEFAFAYGGLSAAWCLEDGRSPRDSLEVALQIEQCLKG